MVVNWAQLIRKSYDSECMVLMVLISVNVSGILCVCFLGRCRLSSVSSEDDSIMSSDIDIKVTFIKIKLFSMYFFGSCYLYHCGLYVWMHSCFVLSEKHALGVIFNIVTVIYVFCLFYYFSLNYNKTFENTPLEKLLLLGIVISNVCIWMDTVFSESTDLFDKNRSTVENTTESVSTSVEVIEITDPFLLPAMIEFSLMAIDLLFSNEKEAPTNGNIIETKRYTTRLQSVSQLVIYVFCFALFSFTFTVLVTGTDRANNNYAYYGYVVLQIILKFVALLLITLSTIHVCKFLTFHLNTSAFILIISCFGNVVYHTLYIIASISTNGIMPVPFVDNAISILMAGIQVYFLLGVHCLESPTSPKNYAIHCACSLLSMINFGLWISDSIGEERRPVFSIALSYVYGEFVWKVINKIVLPLTIFFRFHSGIHFLKLFWECHFLPEEGDQNALELVRQN